MAERVESGNEEVTDESKARKRKPNFSVNGISVITENVKKSPCSYPVQINERSSNRKKNAV